MGINERMPSGRDHSRRDAFRNLYLGAGRGPGSDEARALRVDAARRPPAPATDPTVGLPVAAAHQFGKLLPVDA